MIPGGERRPKSRRSRAYDLQMPSEHAKLAREHLDRAAPHIPDGDDTQAITWLHLAAEAAVEALAQAHGIDTMKLHARKARVAHDLYVGGAMTVDLRDTLRLPNDARKATNYSRGAADLEGRSLEDVHSNVAQAVRDAERGT